MAAMEEEDVESLLEYHGFLIRDFDEPFMVKDRQFLNSENDFPLKCSELVHSKKAKMISQNVSSSISAMSSFAIETKEDSIIYSGQEPRPVVYNNMVSLSATIPVDEVMDDDEVFSSTKSSTQVQPFMKMPSFNGNSEKTEQMAHVSPQSWDFSSEVSSPKSPQASAKSVGKSPFSSVFINSFERKSPANTEAISMPVMLATMNQEKLESLKDDSTTDNSLNEMVADDIIEDKQLTDIHYQDVELDEVGPTYDEEVAEAKLRLIFRCVINCTNMLVFEKKSVA